MYRVEINKSETRKNINQFLNFSTIAFVGISSNKKDFSRALFRDFQKHINHVIPVNPNLTEIDDDKCYPSLKEIDTQIDGVFIITSPSNTKAIVRECVELDIDNIWFHRGVGTGSLDTQIYHYARSKGLNIVPGYCPYMFFPETGFGHKLHRIFFKITGKYPN
ncbi:MAG: CoA-binding protein [Candidatus Kariarchaeaceae archaeon]|jgi:predicted CoA-binding protein